MNFILILIIFVTFLIPIVIYISIKASLSYNKNISPYCEKDSDCPNRTKCIYNADYENKLCSTTKYCSINNNNLTQCKYDPSSSENTCSSLCNNEPVFSCIPVNEQNPYRYKKDNMEYNIKNSPTGSGWCLPNINPKDDIKCNKYTADTILIKNPDDSYNWGCYCKTNLFTHSGSPVSDCTSFIGCFDDNNLQHDLYNQDFDQNNLNINCNNDSDCGPEGKCWTLDGKKIIDKSSGVCYSKWTPDKDTNPIENGFCDCPAGTSFLKVNNGYNSILRCASDSCSPGGILDPVDKKKCDCIQGYINCPNDLDQDTEVAKSCRNTPMCLKDPCGGDNIGLWDTNAHLCKCDKGFKEVPDSSLLQSKCVRRCVGDENICITPDRVVRGECYVTDNNETKCRNCKCPYGQDPTNTCNTKYLARGDICSFSDMKCCPGLTCNFAIGIGGIATCG